MVVDINLSLHNGFFAARGLVFECYVISLTSGEITNTDDTSVFENSRIQSDLLLPHDTFPARWVAAAEQFTSPPLTAAHHIWYHAQSDIFRLIFFYLV